MNQLNKSPASNGALSVVVRPASPKKLKRLRIAWFVLGAIFGMLTVYSAFSFIHTGETYSKRGNSAVKYASLGYKTAPVISAPVLQAAVAPTVSSPVLSQAATQTAQKTEEKPKPLFPASMNVAVHPGDTMMSLLMGKGITHDEAYNIVQSMKGIYNPKNLIVGQLLEMHLDKNRNNGSRPSLSGLSIPVSPVKTIKLARTQDDSFTIKEVKEKTIKSLTRAGGTINSSLYQTGIDSGLPPQMLGEIISALSYDVDFQRDIQQGDTLDVVYERVHTDKNVTTGYGNVIYASLILSGEELTIYRHASSDSYSGYYNKNGESVKKALLRTPINGAHITSGFGMRKHPLLGYSKMHKGIDFGAYTGTPIYAAGDGTIEEAGPKGGYGNYVRIKHSNNYSTAYGHASRIARGIHRGTHVKQGQVIAYVGSTGRSTGPHLHYEILVNGNQVNPSGIKFRTGQTLQGRELAQFKQQVKKLSAELTSIPRKTQVAVMK